jgi:hypothetical protein
MAGTLPIGRGIVDDSMTSHIIALGRDALASSSISHL